MHPTSEFMIKGKVVYWHEEFCRVLSNTPLKTFIANLYKDKSIEGGSDVILLFQFIEGERELTAFDFIIDVVEEGDGTISAYLATIKQRDNRQMTFFDTFEEGKNKYMEQLNEQINILLAEEQDDDDEN